MNETDYHRAWRLLDIIHAQIYQRDKILGRAVCRICQGPSTDHADWCIIPQVERFLTGDLSTSAVAGLTAEEIFARLEEKERRHE